MRLIFYILLLTSAFQKIYCQSIIIQYNKPLNFFILPNQVNETSGLLSYNGSLWTFNDSGGKPILYEISKKSGHIVSEAKLIHGNNIDWEDITQDEDYIYVGDFGNNFGSRKNLKIYKVEKSSLEKSKQYKLNFESISFTYEDQFNYKPSLARTAFDCESMISRNNQLLILTKDWLNYQSTLYTLPKVPGTYIAKKIHTIEINGLVTGAEVLTENKIIICGHNTELPFIAIIDFQNYSILKIVEFPLLKGSQIEGITVSKEHLYLSSEKTYYPPRCFKIRLDEIFAL